VIHRLFHRKGSRLLVALLAALAMAATITTATPQRALAATCTATPANAYSTVYVTAGLTCYGVGLQHACLSMGASGGITAIECADIDMNYTPDSFAIYAVGEYYCQGPSGYATCDAMHVNQVLYTDDPGIVGTYGHPGGYYSCSGNCATQRALVDTYHYTGDYASQGDCTLYHLYVKNSDNSITLPDGVMVTHGADDPDTSVDSDIGVCFS
jgi:hypothetical protein